MCSQSLPQGVLAIIHRSPHMFCFTPSRDHVRRIDRRDVAHVDVEPFQQGVAGFQPQVAKQPLPDRLLRPKIDRHAVGLLMVDRSQHALSWQHR